MAKFYGSIGYGITRETKPGVWINEITEHNVFGDLIRNSKTNENSEKLNEDINISNQVSFIADPYAREHFHLIKYVKFMGAVWKVKTVEVQFPRLVLTLGGVYNENEN